MNSINFPQISRRITEIYHPKYRRNDLSKSLLRKQTVLNEEDNKELIFKRQVVGQQISGNATKIFNKIQKLADIFQTRLEVHEEELLKIVHSEIKKILQQCQITVRQYQNLIQQKNMSSEILDLKYEIKYYQTRACELSQENKILKGQVQRMKKKIQEIKIEKDCQHMAHIQISKKYLKYREKMKSKFVANQCDDSLISLKYVTEATKDKPSKSKDNFSSSIDNNRINKCQLKKISKIDLQNSFFSFRLKTQPIDIKKRIK